ncbi:MAG: methyltransferase domain-containing protein [Candidatus Acidiferrum sp.]
MKRRESILEMDRMLGGPAGTIPAAQALDIAADLDSTSLIPADLQQLYQNRFSEHSEYRNQVWQALCPFFSRWISPDDAVLDLGCGWCEFINAVQCRTKFAMDLNPDSASHVSPGVTLLHQDCSERWQIPSQSLNVVFSSNFFEHLPSKIALENTFLQAHRALKPRGRLIAMGPNIKFVPGQYWDFVDHHLPLTELSIMELMRKCGFEGEFCADRFLPFTMSQGQKPPLWTVRLYLALPWVWRFWGKQFLVVGRKKTR